MNESGNKVILAPAGSRKTQHIVDLCSDLSEKKRRLVITFTTHTQSILNRRLLSSPAAKGMPRVQGWYAFLLDNIVRPYIHAAFPDARVSSLNFVTGSMPRNLRGSAYYCTRQGAVYNQRIALLASKILAKDSAAVIDRLERIYDEIYIDEAQDLGGNDLVVLEYLFSSKIHLTLVGDTRQGILTTSQGDRKHKAYAGLGLLTWFQEQKARGAIELEEWTETHRCCQEVISFADSMFEPGLYPPTESKAEVPAGMHHGVWLVTEEYVVEYIKRFSPACYRYNKTTKLIGTDSALTFKLCKGATEEHVLIFPTGTMLDFLRDRGKALADKSRMEAYVAITRARWSVALFVNSNKAHDLELPIWIPDGPTESFEDTTLF